ncbi:hypothetical protein [Natrononativus amylolyticus]|uniref:hypothetical protein n=1 Tax=Natrononativus amylolyticus TaxID=2963434 RepID=UPI0020CBDA0A|nr:hypothetical protein [Natrononativus amylolyticus]
MVNDTTDSGASEGVTRRGTLALAGLAGVGLFGAGRVGASDGQLSLEDDLDLNGNDLINGDNFWPSSNYASFCTSGSGDGHAQLYDTAAGTHFLRAFEGEADSPGPVEFQAPIKGARADAPGTPRPGPLRVLEGAVVDNLSVVGHNRIDVVAAPEIDHEGDLAAEIAAYLEDQEAVDHCFVLPSGRYSWNSELSLTDFEFFGLVGAPAATLEIESDDVDLAFRLGSGRGGASRTTLQNVTVDISGSDDRDAGIARINVEDRAVLENVTLRGQRYRQGPNGGDRFTVLVNLTEETGLGTIRNVTLPDGDRETGNGSVGHAIPFSADPPHEGVNVFEGCYVEGFVDNGFYVANSPGKSILRGCTAKNNGGGNVRLGDGDVCRDSRIVLENGADSAHPGCGLWLQGGSPLAENVTIDAPGAANDVIRVNSDADGGRICNSNVYLGPDADAPAIRITQGGNDTLEPVILENVTVHDDTRYDGDRGFSVLVRRGNVTLRDCEVRISESDELREGVYISEPDVRLDRCTIEVANGGCVVNLDAEDTDLFGCRLRGTGSRSAGIGLSNGCNPDTVRALGLRADNVSVRDWISSGLSTSDLLE